MGNDIESFIKNKKKVYYTTFYSFIERNKTMLYPNNYYSYNYYGHNEGLTYNSIQSFISDYYSVRNNIFLLEDKEVVLEVLQLIEFIFERLNFISTRLESELCNIKNELILFSQKII